MTANQSKFNWYQAGAKVVISIARRGLSADDCTLKYNPQNNSLQVLWKEETIFSTTLYRSIAAEHMSITCTPSKVEVHLEKLVDDRWPDLSALEEITDTTAKQSSSKPTEWERLAKEVEKEEEEESNNGVDKLFQKIYKDADDDVKKAMMKSFTESCGTVLSTNWSEIKAKKTDVKPPEDVEFRKYEL